MKIAAAPTPQVTVAPQSRGAAPTEAPAPTQPTDHVEVGADSGESKLNYKALAIAGGAVLGGAALGIAAGLHGGALATVVALASVPGLGIAGAALGGIGFEKFGPSSSEYRAIGGALLGGVVGLGAGIGQAFMAAGSGSPLLATTLGVSGGLMGLAVLFKATTSSN